MYIATPSSGQVEKILFCLSLLHRCFARPPDSGKKSPTQIDLPRGAKSGLIEAQEVLASVRGIAMVRFTSGDVVRHPLVGRIVEAYEAHTDQSTAAGGRSDVADALLRGARTRHG